jgi:hypothetical protein
VDADPVYIGIDPTAGGRPLNYAVLDGDLGVAEGSGALDDVLRAVLAHPRATVAVDAPQSPSGGLMAQPELRARLGLPPNSRSWSGYKVCEYELRRRGIGLYSTPAEVDAAPRWMKMGYRLYAALREAGFVTYAPNAAAERQVLEVHPHACYTVLLGHVPLRKDTLEGRLQRQLMLYREGVDVLDPMDALEELTPHRLLAPTFDLPGLRDHDALDALAAAYTAYLAACRPEQVTLVGDEGEGQIVVPVARDAFLDHYGK